MANNDIEIEIKFKLLNKEEVRDFLDKNGESTSKNVTQKDTYFIPAHRDFLEPEFPYEWLRLRETNKGAYITYKHFYPENVEKTDYCDEFETRVENAESIKKIFGSLNMKEAVVVSKSRDTWIFEDVEIAIDDVEGLGSYIELETTLPYDNPVDGKDYLAAILEKLGAKLGEQDFRGYPYLIHAQLLKK